MATPTYTLLGTTTLTSSTSRVDLTSISQDYKDLIVVADYTDTGTGGAANVWFRPNNSGTGYNSVRFYTYGATGVVTDSTNGDAAFKTFSAASGQRYQIIYQIFDYASTTKYKSVLIKENWANDNGNIFTAGMWSDLAAITSLTFQDTLPGAYAPTSTFSVYGIAG
jgi:hypothetical protein